MHLTRCEHYWKKKVVNSLVTANILSCTLDGVLEVEGRGGVGCGETGLPAKFNGNLLS